MEAHGSAAREGTNPEGHAPTVARTEFPKATHAQTRAHNAALVLRALYDLGPISRADIARLTGLTRTSVGELVSDLERDGLATDVGRGPSTGGKQPTLVALNADARTIIAVDLSERTFTAALANLRGELDHATPTRSRRPRRRRRRRARPRTDRGRPRRGDEPDPRHRRRHPGHRRQEGTIRWAVGLDWQDLPLATILEERHGLPTVVANDSRAAAFATYLFEGEDRPDNLVAIKVGRGVGAGLILRDQLFGGDGDGAGEIGHVVVDPDGVECHCGRFGCLETVASAPAILRDAAAAGATHTTIDDLARASADGDDRVLPVVRAAGRAIGSAIANLTGTLDVRQISILGHGDRARRPVVRRDPRRGRAGARSARSRARSGSSTAAAARTSCSSARARCC